MKWFPRRRHFLMPLYPQSPRRIGAALHHRLWLFRGSAGASLAANGAVAAPFPPPLTAEIAWTISSGSTLVPSDVTDEELRGCIRAEFTQYLSRRLREFLLAFRCPDARRRSGRLRVFQAAVSR